MQIIAELDGERVLRTDVHCGYLHRGFEKECEDAHLAQPHPLRRPAELLLGADQRLRLLRGGRAADGHRDHAALPLPAHAAVRVLAPRRPPHLRRRRADGAGRDDRVPVPGDDPRLHVRAPRRADRRARDVHLRPHRRPGARPARRLARRAWRRSSSSTRTSSAACTALVDRNRIFIDRMRDVGVDHAPPTRSATATPAPILRSTGVPRDLRKDTPYLAYAELDFEVPVGIKGDNYDRYYVRMREMDESVHMIRQLVDMLPDGPDQRRRPPLQLPREGARLHRDRVADQPLQAGHGRPAGARRRGLQRARGAQRRARLLPRQHRRGHAVQGALRAPSFVHMGGAHQMLDGYQLADIVPTFGSINMIGGECDR